MLNYKLLKKNINEIAKKLKKRGFILNIKLFKFMEEKRKKLYFDIEKNIQKKKIISNTIRKKNNLNILEINNLKEKSKKINYFILNKKKKLESIKNKINSFLIQIPNLPDDNIPLTKNKKLVIYGKRPIFNFKIKDHINLCKKKGLDFSSGVKLASSKFVVIKDKIALLHRKLIQFMLDLHTKKHNYIELNVPYISNYSSLYNTGQLPKFENDLFKISSKNIKKNNYYLIPTGEVPLTNLLSNKILLEKDLPLKFVSCTPCFRSEKLSYGQDNKGLIRLHQFDKVELVQIVKPEKSNNILEEITYHAEKVLKLLKLPYRKILLCSNDIGFAASKTYDLEVWFPSLKNYKEISSCSNMLDFQSKRMKTKYRINNTKKTNFVHTLNASGLAISRTLGAILENYQLSNGKIEIPKILQKKYMRGIKFI